MDSKQNITVLLGLFETGLAVGRSLGRNGIKVFGFDLRIEIGFYSKFIVAMICPNPAKQERDFINFLIEFSKDKAKKPVIMITSDLFLVFISKHRSELSEYFYINLPSKYLIDSISDKFKQYQIAEKHNIDVPFTATVKNLSEIDNIRNDLIFPLIIKAREVNQWRKFMGGKKAIKINNFEELLKYINMFFNNRIPIILQEIIPGPDTNHFKYCAYFAEGTPISEFILKKIRQFPIRFGIGSSVVSCENIKLRKIGNIFFSEMKYNGIGSAEFKLDERDGKLKLIEINPRYWQQNSLAEACGINFPVMDYDYQTKGSMAKIKHYSLGYKWVNIYSDFSSFLDYRREHSLNLIKWLTSLKGHKTYSDFTWDDPIPGFYQINFGKRIFDLPNFIKRKIFQ